MKLNKLLLVSTLIMPLFMASCNPEIKIKGLTVEGYELLYACSQERSVNIRFAGSGCEFVDNFKKEYIKWDSSTSKHLQGIEIKNIKKTAYNNIQVTFVKPYSGDPFESESNLVKFTIDKAAFKNNVIDEDVKGTLYVFADKAYIPYAAPGGDNISFRLDFSKKMTEVTLAEFSSPSGPIDINEYEGTRITQQEIIQFEYEDNESLFVRLSNLKDADENTYQILIGNTDNLTLFNNLPNNYGFRIKIRRTENYYEIVDRFYGSYIYSKYDE